MIIVLLVVYPLSQISLKEKKEEKLILLYIELIQKPRCGIVQIEAGYPHKDQEPVNSGSCDETNHYINFPAEEGTPETAWTR